MLVLSDVCCNEMNKHLCFNVSVLHTAAVLKERASLHLRLLLLSCNNTYSIGIKEFKLVVAE